MPDILLTCLYCNNSWKDESYRYIMKKPECAICKDKNIKKQPLDESKRNIYYQDDPLPDAYVESKKEEDNNDIYDGFWGSSSD